MDRSIQTRAMASDQRIAILRLLGAPERHFADQWSADPAEFGVCMSLIADKLGLTQPTVSRHLDLLKQAGFLTVQRHRKWAYCRRDQAAILDYLDWLNDQVAGEPTLA